MTTFDPRGATEPPRLPGDDFNVPFAEAISWARERRAMLPDEFYGARLQAVRARGFAIAGLAALDQVQAAADSLAEATAGGQTLREWQKGIRESAPDVFSLGKARRELIFRNAVQTHYGIGRTIQQRENAAARPFLMWDAINDSRTRPTHRAMDGHIAPIDDPTWARWTPPAGHNCRCSRIALSEAQARARGYPKPAPDVEPDAGWEGDPTEGNEDLVSVIRARQAACLTPFAAKKVRVHGVHCDDGGARERLLQAAAHLAQDGAFPALKDAGALREVRPEVFTQVQLFEQFRSAVDQRAKAAAWMPALGADLAPDRSLFLKQDGSWKIGKNGRARWLAFLADTLIDPAEVRFIDGPPNAPLELRILGGYSVGSDALFTMLAYRLIGGQWHGWTAYQMLHKDLIRYRLGSSLAWLRNG